MPSTLPLSPPRRSHFTTSMNDQDEAMWLLEADPAMRSTITAVARLDRSPDRRRLEETLRRAAVTIPRLRQRVVERPPALGPPRWVDDGDPDLRYHLRHIEVPAPHTFDAVLRMAEPVAMSGFDTARPLWEVTVVDGLAGGEAALILKVHHALTDGIAAVELATFLFDEARDGKVVALPAAPPPPPAASPLGRLRAVARAASSVAAHPGDAVASTAGTAVSLARLLWPAPGRLSPLFVGHSPRWRFDVLEGPLDDWRAAARATGSSVNDVFLAAVAGGTRRYHERHGCNLAEIRVLVPVNVRRDGDAMGGNRFTPLRFVLPIGEPDPVRRIEQCRNLSRRWRDEPALPLTDRVAAVFDRLPRALAVPVLASLFRSTDVTATNVPGFPYPVFVAGAEIRTLFAFAPPSGAAVNVALLSHVDRACIGINSDVSAVADTAGLVADIAAAVDEVLAVRHEGAVAS